MTYNNFPEILRNQKQWVLWKKEFKDGKPTKVPYKNTAQRAASTNPETWNSFDGCNKILTDHPESFGGLGYVFNGGIVGIDLDHCLNGDVLKPWAEAIVNLFPSYIETSPSGTGLHIFIACDVDFSGKKTYIEDGDIERYCKGRYFTVTGNVYKEYNTIKRFSPEQFLTWHNSYIKEEPNLPALTNNLPATTLLPQDNKILEVMFKSKHGDKLKDLYEGNWRKHFTKENDSQSEADLSFVGSLMFFCGNNTATVDRIFRTSKLMRDKWNRKDIRDGMFQKTFCQEPMKWDTPTPEEKSDHKIISLNELLKMTPKENPFLLQGMIVEGSVNALTSDSGKGKSLLMLKMAEAIAQGEKFLGEFTTKKSKVLIVDLEMSEDDVIGRTQSIIGHEIEGIDFHHSQSFNILNDNDFKWLKEAVSANNYKLVVLDTYSMAAGSKNENDNAEANLVNKRFLELTNVCGCTILFLHHHRKLQKGEVMSQSTSRGATDIIGKTASHLLIDTKDVTIANESEGLKGIRIVVEQMKRRRATGFDRYAVVVYYNPFNKKTHFDFVGYDEKAENAMAKTKGLILGKMENGEEYTMKDIRGMAKDSRCVYTAVKELIEIDKIVAFRYPQADDVLESGKKMPSNTKIYFLELKNEA